jgi:glycosyltransferase involved in cell wall biosynthesis
VISIVVPTYNRATTLSRAIESVLAQTYVEWELIIVDDGSTDDTADVLAGFADSRIRVFRFSANRGVAATKNSGLDQIAGEWFTILDSDDELAPDALASMLDCAERTGANAITCDCADAATGEVSGTGPKIDGWMTPADAARCQGEHWGMTSTALLGDLRLDERLPGHEGILWMKIGARARRYYLHRSLRVYHTEGTDRVTRSLRSQGVGARVQALATLGEDGEYLSVLRTASPSLYARTVARVWVARGLRPLLGLGDRRVRGE